MPYSGIGDQELHRIGRIVRSWAHKWNESRPKNVRVALTTRNWAMKKIHGDDVCAPGGPIYLVTLEGTFFLRSTEGEVVQSGTWAALFIEPPASRVSTYTVRPSSHVPNLSPAPEGPACELDLGGD
ncbi:hypothetical protein GCM10018785_45140 [Streptomyces longispororuber]|uniref:Uncharacterized protein n=1 Tax=Streptomyces longispororuber TaxID=68230 RepID=A0A918ZV88_9ACTN|nr:hypothetical protein GCM10018785_45140 [Streptomyces longispororuber]